MVAPHRLKSSSLSGAILRPFGLSSWGAEQTESGINFLGGAQNQAPFTAWAGPVKLINTLGFDAEGLIARVWWMRSPSAAPGPWSHMTVRVHLNGSEWLADSGFGSCVPTSALEIGATHPQETAHERYRVRPTHDGRMLEAELDRTWARVYEVRRTPASPDEYGTMNELAATQSHFAFDLILARTTPEERIVVSGNRLTRRSRSGIIERSVLDATELEEVIRTRFALPFDPRWGVVLERAATHPT